VNYPQQADGVSENSPKQTRDAELLSSD